MSDTPVRRAVRGATVGLSAAAVAFATAVVPLDAAAAVEPGDQVNILAFNDLHGYYNYIDGDFVCAVLDARDLNPNHALLSVGDNVGASVPYSALYDDEPTLDYLNVLGVDAGTIGDHEYDQGRDDLTERIEPRTDFPDLAANVYVPATGKRLHEAYTIVDAGDVKVAVVGAVTTQTVDRVAPALLEGLEFRDPVDSVNQAITELNASGKAYDVLVASYHEGPTDRSFSLVAPEPYVPGRPPSSTDPIFDRIVGETSAEVDAILTGDSHQRYAYNAPVPGEDGEVRPILQAGSRGERLGMITLELGPDGDWAPTDVSLRETSDGVPGVSQCTGHPTHEAALQIRPAYGTAVTDGGRKPVGSNTADITTSWGDSTASYVDGVRTATADVVEDRYPLQNHQRASAKGNLVADSMTWYLEEAGLGGEHEVIGFIDPDSVAGPLWFEEHSYLEEGDGVISFFEAYSQTRHSMRPLMTGEVTGAQFVQLLEEQWQRTADGHPVDEDSGFEPYLAFSVSDNVEYTFDSTRELDDRILEVRVDGVPIDSGATYTIITLDFRFADRVNLGLSYDNFMWTLVGAANVREAGVLYGETILNYVEDHPDLAPDFSQRQLEVQRLDGETPGLRVLGMESQSLGAPLITEVQVDAGELGTFTAPVVRDEETGRLVADVGLGADFCVPEGSSAILEITASPDTGTSLTHELSGFGGEDCGNPEPPAEPDGPEDFSDVLPSNMFYDEIMWMRGEGYSTGWTVDNTFRPLQPVNRDAMAAFLHRMAGSPDVTLPESSPFTDVREGQEHYEAIIWAYQEGVTTGWPDGTFRPTTPIARDAMAAFVHRYSGAPEVEDPTSAVFSDVSAGTMFAPEIAWMKTQGITTGWPDGTFRPLAPTNRDATAAFLYRMEVEQGITYTPTQN